MRSLYSYTIYKTYIKVISINMYNNVHIVTLFVASSYLDVLKLSFVLNFLYSKNCFHLNIYVVRLSMFTSFY